ncbi:MAG: CRISPR-associated endonuclease Cas1 [Verrucomicrobia bacterium]|nr:CRISPR-associated endonuclease Cas1 [Verrucomicrobiota bacterium]
MPTVCINQPDCRVRLHTDRLEIIAIDDETGKEQVLREIPIRDIDRLITSESVHFTPAAMAELLRNGIPIQIFSWTGQFLGNFLPAQNSHGLARLRQYQCTLDPAFALDIARRVVTAKIYNQRRVLQRIAAGRADDDTAEPEANTDPAPLPPACATELRATLRWMDSALDSLKTCTTIDEVRGYEGAATARYFHDWAGFLPTEFPFERRSTRPPLNPVNACISFGATIIYNEMVAFLHAHGLDPALGTLHNTEDGRWSLALDLIEPFRPVIVEALALDLFTHQMLNKQHFENRNGGVYLNSDGRKKFFLQYERRMERQFMSEFVGHRTTLRQQLENQAVMYKTALESPDKLKPFQIN